MEVGAKTKNAEFGAPVRRSSVSILDIIGFVAVAATTLWFTRKGLWRPLNSYDEGILLSNADAMLHGKILYRDIYANYAPGTFTVLAGALALFGKTATVSRVIGALLHTSLGILSGRIGGRVGRIDHRFSWLSAGLVSIWSVPLLSVPFAWVWGLVLSLLSIDRFLAWRPKMTGRRAAVLGVLLGLVGFFRHEMFVFGLAAFVGLAALQRLLQRPPLFGAGRKRAAIVFGAATVTNVVGWTPFLLSAGVKNVYDGLVGLQVDRILPGRKIPIPVDALFASVKIGPLTVPAVLGSYYVIGMLLVLLSVPATLTVVWRQKSGQCDAIAAGLRDRQNSGLLSIGALAVAAIPQMLQRGDPTHVLFAVPPALLLASIGLEHGFSCRNASAVQSNVPVKPTVFGRMLRGSAVGVSVVGLLLAQADQLAAPLHAPKVSRATLGGRFGLTFAADNVLAKDRTEAVNFLTAHTKSDEYVFSGCSSNRRAQSNSIDLYFLADRRGGTKWMQYDPGLQDTEEYQRKMIADLTRNKVKAIVLTPCEYTPEDNRSAVLGSTSLDIWLEKNFEIVGGEHGYQHLLRRSNTST